MYIVENSYLASINNYQRQRGNKTLLQFLNKDKTNN